jgi:secondary thiamine-phosphate synthase enzyme
MKSLTEYLTFNLPVRMAFENITPKVEDIVKRSGVREGLCLCNAMHITASVFINDDEPGLHEDYKGWLESLAPFDASPQTYRHNRTGEDNADAHMKRQIMGREVVVAVTNGKLDFGPWEQIFYGEFDGRRPKRVLVKVIGEGFSGDEIVNGWLRAILGKLPVGSVVSNEWSEHLREFFTHLQFYLPALLRVAYADWEWESLDGFSTLTARKIGPNEASIEGLCILISDYTMTPFRFRFRFDDDPRGRSLASLKLELGERTESGLVRAPWPGSQNKDALANTFLDRIDDIKWFYQVSRGDDRS